LLNNFKLFAAISVYKKMEVFEQIWGNGSSLTIWQMSLRAIVAFPTAWILIRISGRRSFGFRTPLDNVIVILLGAMLARGVVGASSFVSVTFACLSIVLLHRIVAYMIARSEKFGKFINGKKIVLYKEGQFLRTNMRRALVCEEDIRQGVREMALSNDMESVDTVYLERDGQISVIKKQQITT
jgi:uncharacterized membrane protein YcaP (DUF421 family)